MSFLIPRKRQGCFPIYLLFFFVKYLFGRQQRFWPTLYPVHLGAVYAQVVEWESRPQVSTIIAAEDETNDWIGEESKVGNKD